MRLGACLRPDLEQSVPGTSAEGPTIRGDSKAADAVVMADQLVDHHALLCVPHVTVIVVITGEEDAAGGGEGNGGDATENFVIRVFVELLIGADIEQATGAIVTACAKGIPIRENLDRVDIGFMARESFLAVFACTMVPKLGSGITTATDEVLLVLANAHGHNIASVVIKHRFGRSSFHIPENASTITTSSDDFVLLDKSAARKISFVLS